MILAAAILSAQQTINGSLEHDGLERTYILYVPSSYDGSEAVPLVINFHGRTSNALSQMNYGDFRAIADRENFIIAHPQGTEDPTGITYWNAQFSEMGADDIGFTSALIDQFASDYNIDLDRVYSTGMSNGGFMSYTLACELGHKIAAVASVTGTMTLDQVAQTCNPTELTPVMEIHGTADGVVPYDGDGNFMASISSVIAHWVSQNNCQFEMAVELLPDINGQDDSTVERYVFTECDEDSSIELFKVLGGGHTWPGSAFPFGVTNYDINASEEIWRFFSQYDLNGIISATDDKSDEQLQVQIFPVPVRDQLQLSFSSAQERTLSIMSMEAIAIQNQEPITSKNITMNVARLKSGIYLLQIQEGSKIQTYRFVKL